VITRSRWLEVHFWLKRRLDDPRFHRVELIPRDNWIHWFRLTDRSQLDAALARVVREAYAVGNQERGR
jgi:hypothetical protein